MLHAVPCTKKALAVKTLLGDFYKLVPGPLKIFRNEPATCKSDNRANTTISLGSGKADYNKIK